MEIENDVLNYVVKFTTTEGQKERETKFTGTDYQVKINAEIHYICAVAVSSKAELYLNDELISFGNDEAYLNEHYSVVKATGMFYPPEKWRKRFMRLVDSWTDAIFKKYQVGEYVPENIRAQEISVELAGVLSKAPEQIVEHLSFADNGNAVVDLKGLGIERTEQLSKQISLTLEEYWYNEGFELEYENEDEQSNKNWKNGR